MHGITVACRAVTKKYSMCETPVFSMVSRTAMRCIARCQTVAMKPLVCLIELLVKPNGFFRHVFEKKKPDTGMTRGFFVLIISN